MRIPKWAVVLLVALAIVAALLGYLIGTDRITIVDRDVCSAYSNELNRAECTQRNQGD